MEKTLHELQEGRLYNMNRKEGYRDLCKWRATKRRYKNRYYGKTAIYEPSRFTESDCEMILEHNVTDHELSDIIHHSVRSIQIKRSRLLKELRKETKDCNKTRTELE